MIKYPLDETLSPAKLVLNGDNITKTQDPDLNSLECKLLDEYRRLNLPVPRITSQFDSSFSMEVAGVKSLDYFIKHIRDTADSDSQANALLHNLIPEMIKYSAEFNLYGNKILTPDEKNYFELFHRVKPLSKKFNCSKAYAREHKNLLRLAESLPGATTDYFPELEKISSLIDKSSELYGMWDSDRFPRHFMVNKTDDDFHLVGIDFNNGTANVPLQEIIYRITDAYLPYFTNDVLVDSRVDVLSEGDKQQAVGLYLKMIDDTIQSKKISKSEVPDKVLALIEELKGGSEVKERNEFNFYSLPNRVFRNFREANYSLNKLAQGNDSATIYFNDAAFHHHMKLGLLCLEVLNAVDTSTDYSNLFKIVDNTLGDKYRQVISSKNLSNAKDSIYQKYSLSN